MLKNHREYTMGAVYETLERICVGLSRPRENESPMQAELRWSQIESLHQAMIKLRWACRRHDERLGID